MKHTFAIAAFAVSMSIHAGIVCELNDVKDFNLPSRLEFSNEKICKVKQTSWFLSAKKYPIDPAKTYKISGEFRAAQGAKVSGVIRIGFYPADEKGHLISVINVNCVPQSETELAETANVGDTILKVKDASKWQAKNYGYVAFDVDPSGKMRDIPCFTLSEAGIKRIEKSGNVWEVELHKPIKSAYAAGVAVREHLGGWGFQCSNPLVPAEDWSSLSWTVKPGQARKNTREQWLFGAKQFIVVLVLPEGVEFRNVKVETAD